MLINHYRCPRCQIEWQDAWDCPCDDHRPACDQRLIIPRWSEDVEAPEPEP